MGYVLIPSVVPDSLQFQGAERERYEEYCADTCLVYSSSLGENRLSVCYPWCASLDDVDLQLQVLPERPDDARQEVTINGKTAYITRGMWTRDTIRKAINAEYDEQGMIEGEWDYEDSLSLMFQLELSERMVTIRLEARPFTEEWITSAAMIEVAKSINNL